MSDGKTFPALKSMDAMKTLLSRIPTCQFKNHMNNFIQQTINSVKNASVKDFEDWASNIGSAAEDQGRALFQEYLRNNEQMKEEDIKSLTGEMTGVIVRYTNELHEIDFTVVYECIHIHEYLHCKEDFLKKYKDIRQVLINNYIIEIL